MKEGAAFSGQLLVVGRGFLVPPQSSQVLHPAVESKTKCYKHASLLLRNCELAGQTAYVTFSIDGLNSNESRPKSGYLMMLLSN